MNDPRNDDGSGGSMDEMTNEMIDGTPVAVVTGASRGLGRALAAELVARGWTLVVDARGAEALRHVTEGLGDRVFALPGDVADASHRQEIADAVDRLGRLDLLVNNASALGPSPLPTLDRYPLPELERVYRVNVVARSRSSRPSSPA